MPRNDVQCSPKNIVLKWLFQNRVFRTRNESLAAMTYYKERLQQIYEPQLGKVVSKNCHLATVPAVAWSK